MKAEIIAIGSAADLKEQTKTQTLEEAFLKLTGTAIREEHGTPGMNMMHAWHGGRR